MIVFWDDLKKNFFANNNRQSSCCEMGKKNWRWWMYTSRLTRSKSIKFFSYFSNQKSMWIQCFQWRKKTFTITCNVYFGAWTFFSIIGIYLDDGQQRQQQQKKRNAMKWNETRTKIKVWNKCVCVCVCREIGIGLVGLLLLLLCSLFRIFFIIIISKTEVEEK